MLNENAEARIKNYVEVTISNAEIMLQHFLRESRLELLDIAINELRAAGHYWNVYHATITPETMDTGLFKRLEELRKEIQENTPPGI